jgi:hypothetical protein
LRKIQYWSTVGNSYILNKVVDHSAETWKKRYLNLHARGPF